MKVVGTMLQLVFMNVKLLFLNVAVAGKHVSTVFINVKVSGRMLQLVFIRV